MAESSVADSLISGDEAAVYADKGYESKHRRAALHAQGIKDRICHRSHKHQTALPHWQVQRNKGIAKRRSAVERVFGTAKRVFGYLREREQAWKAGDCALHGGMWNEPYLETCCRSALHRLVLCGDAARPAGLKDGPCLERLQRLGLSELRADGRYAVTAAGRVRHGSEVLRQPA